LAHVPFEDTKWSRDGSHQDFPQGTTIAFPQLLQNGNEARSCGQEEPSFHLPSHYWGGAGPGGWLTQLKSSLLGTVRRMGVCCSPLWFSFTLRERMEGDLTI